MKEESIRENGCKIFCIYFQHSSEKSKKKGEQNLKEIAKLGEPKDIYNSNSLLSLCEVFNKIADIIETNYKLKLNKNI
jgi:hypothetical protein